MTMQVRPLERGQDEGFQGHPRRLAAPYLPIAPETQSQAGEARVGI